VTLKRLIAIDGLDGCGKDTHAERVREALARKGVRVTVISHPSSRMLGRASKRALQSAGAPARLLATLFYAADVLMSVRWYKRQDDGTVVFVRYLLGTAYLPRRLAPLSYAVFRRLLPFPDLALFIDIEPDVAIRRIEARDHTREMFETVEKLSQVRTVARAITSSADWVTVDNSPDGEGAFLEVERLLRDRGIA
jgi:dTMP kinase